MKIVVMDESIKRTTQICELLQRKKHKTIACGDSSAFLEALDEPGIEKVVMNVESWQRGKSMYKYFNVPKRLSTIPVIFFNAPENFVNINAREHNDADRVLPKLSEPEAIADAIE